MKSSAKFIEIYPYNPRWPEIFQTEARLIKDALGESCIALHHIGSTSIEGLCSKRDIDILCVINNLKNNFNLENIGYIFKGEFNIPLRYFFSKNNDYSKVNLHVVEPDHGFITLQLAFMDYLRTNNDALEEYAALKERLIKDPKSHQKINSNFTGYNLGKNDFIKETLQKAGFDDLILNIVTHYNEWEEYHRIRETEIFEPMDVTYDRNHPSIKAENNYHFVLYKGAKIVAVAQVEFLNVDTATLRSLATDEPHKNKGYGAFMINLLEKWIASKGCSVIKLHSNTRTESFYRKLGYNDIEFDDPSANPLYVNLGKLLKM